MYIKVFIICQMFYSCIFKQVQNDLLLLLLLLWFRLALQINCNASFFISYNSCKFDRR